jgi:hypothetical protein
MNDDPEITLMQWIAKTYKDGHKPNRLSIENGMIPFDKLLAISDKEVLGKVREILTKDEIALALAAILAILAKEACSGCGITLEMYPLLQSLPKVIRRWR